MTDVVGLRFVSEGDQQVINAIQRVDKAQQNLQRTSQALGKAFDRGSATQDMVVRAYVALERAGVSYASVLKGVEQNERMAAEAAQYHVNQLLGLDSATKSAKDSAQAMAQALREQEAAAARVAPAINELLRIDAPFRSAAQSAEAFSAELRKQESATAAAARATQEFYRDLLKIDQPYASAEASAAAFVTELRKQEVATAAAARATQEFYRDLLKIDQPFRSAEASAQAFVTELRKQEVATAAAARATQEFYRDLLKIDQPYRSAAASADVFAEAQQRASASYGQLRAAIDPAYAAQMRMKQAHEVVKQALAQEVITREEAARTLVAYRAQAMQTSAALQGQAGATMFSSRAQNASGMAMQQVGYQVGDFLVQVQSGTNAMVAFGQQATQLVGVLPMFGSVLGVSGTALIGLSAGLGIAIPLITAFGAMWMRAADSQDEAASSTKSLQAELESLDQTLQDWVRSKKAAAAGITIEELLGTQGIEQAQTKLEEATAALAELQEVVTSPGFGAAGGISLDFFKGFLDADTASLYEAALRKVIDAENTLATLRQKQGEEQFANFAEQKRELDQQLALQQEIAQFGRDSAQVRTLELEQEIANRKRAIQEQVAAKDITVAQGVALEKIVEEFLRAEAAAEGVKSAVASTDLSSLAAQAGLLASSMGVAADEAARYNAALNRQAGIPDSTGQPRFGFGGLGSVEDGAGLGVGFARLGFGNLDEPPLRTLTPMATPAGRSGGRSGGRGGAAREQEDYLKNLLLEAQHKQRLVGLTEEQTRRQELLFEMEKRKLPIDEERIAMIVATESYTRSLMEAEEQRMQMMQTVEGHIENAFMSFVDGSATVEEAFKGMLRNILLAVYQQEVAKPAASAVSTLFRGLLGFANGGAFNKGVEFFADGGVVGSPTMFQHSGGLGVMGEAGPEAIMPLKRGANGKLGVQMDGAAGGNVTVNQYFQVSANGDESVRRIVRQEAPRMAEMAKSAVVDAKRRGGTYGRSF